MKESRSIQALQKAIEKGEERIKIMDAEIKELKEFKGRIHWKNYELDTAMKNAKLRIHQDLGIWVSIKDSSGLTKSYYLGKIATIA
jgi:predicted RNase H-like nuclease (RuvC/YqgF family)